MGCDSLVAMASATADGVTLFAKNSDRPPRECQRVVRLPRRCPAAGATVRCQYLEIPEDGETATILGSQPHWLWGLEHGVNEHRVAIGNQTVFAREPLGPAGLLGMDLVRLGLERGRNARQALAAITGLLERHGQGGSGQLHVEWPYHNAFLIADPREAWVLETSGRHWAARPVDALGNVTNGVAIGADWTEGSSDLTSYALAQGWWAPERGRVDFAAAYGDSTGVPPNLCSERRRRAAGLLAEMRGRLTPAALRAVLRDHYDGSGFPTRREFDDPHFFSLCMHADPLDNTTAGMVATLPSNPAAPAAAWVCLGSPCVGAFVPLYLEGTVPAELSHGGAEPDARSPWWRMRELLSLVERDPARFAPLVRSRWDVFEASVSRAAVAIEAEATEARNTDDPAGAAALLTGFMAGTVTEYRSHADALVREISAKA
jgi:dipeptidase